MRKRVRGRKRKAGLRAAVMARKAAASASRALALDPGSADAHWVLAESVVKTDPRRARAAYGEYLRLAKDGPHASAARQALERLK